MVYLSIHSLGIGNIDDEFEGSGETGLRTWNEYQRVLLVNQLCSFDHFNRRRQGWFICNVSLAVEVDGSIRTSGTIKS